MRKLHALLITGIASAMMVAGPIATHAGAAPQALTKIKIVDFNYMPKTVTVPVGTQVGWKNFGATNHTSTSDVGRWDSGTLAPGAQFKVTFRRAGTYTYHCEFHPTIMTGTITVT